jgi:endonuclease YncB( thermonuclease family)
VENIFVFTILTLLGILTLAKFGNPSMPFGDEAKEFTDKLINNKVVRIKLLRKDQYNRAVAKVSTPGFLPFTRKDVTLQLAERGLATLYTGGGAEYDVS